MSIKGNTKEWYVGKNKSTLFNWSGKRLDFRYDDLNKITYFFADKTSVGNVTFIKKTDEKILFDFRYKSNDAVLRAINLIEENNPNVLFQKVESVKSAEHSQSKYKLCKFCKTEIPIKATICPNCKKSQNQGCIIVFLFIILFLIFFAVFSTLLTKNRATPPKNNDIIYQNTVNASSETTAYEEETNTFNVGDLFESEKLNISYLDSGDYSSDNMFIEPASGNKFIFIDLSIQNTGDTDLSVGSTSFTCYADDTKCSQSVVTADDQMDIIATVSPKKYLKGKIYFEVPKDSQNIEVEFETSFWTQEKIYFIVK